MIIWQKILWVTLICKIENVICQHLRQAHKQENPKNKKFYSEWFTVYVLLTFSVRYSKNRIFHMVLRSMLLKYTEPRVGIFSILTPAVLHICRLSLSSLSCWRSFCAKGNYFFFLPSFYSCRENFIQSSSVAHSLRFDFKHNSIYRFNFCLHWITHKKNISQKIKEAEEKKFISFSPHCKKLIFSRFQTVVLCSAIDTYIRDYIHVIKSYCYCIHEELDEAEKYFFLFRLSLPHTFESCVDFLFPFFKKVKFCEKLWKKKDEK